MKIFISGISGTGMGPLALMAKQAGYEVCGTDLAKGAIYDELVAAGIEVKIGPQDGEFLREKIMKSTGVELEESASKIAEKDDVMLIVTAPEWRTDIHIKEDIIEEVVGDIFDESDEVVEEVKKIRKGIYIVNGMMNIDDFFELIDYHDEFDTNYSTVGGLCQEFFDDFPNVGDSFHIGNYKITITKADRYSVDQVKACRVYRKKD